MKRIKRDSNYMVFIAGLDTTATNRGDIVEAVKGIDGWHIIDSNGKVYRCPLATLRALILEIRAQANIDWRQAYKEGATTFTRAQLNSLGVGLF